MKNKTNYIMILALLIMLFLGFITVKALTQDSSVSKNDFYNECFVLSANVFLRVNSLPVKESLEEVISIETKITEFYDSYSILKAPKDTQEATNIMQRLFESSFEVIELVKKYKNGDADVTHFMYLDKLQETQALYFEYAKYIDKMAIPIYESSIKSIEILTLELFEGGN